MFRAIKYIVWLGCMAGIGILVGCFIHGQRTNQPTIMSGVAFVRELPQGERIVGSIETWWFTRKETEDLKDFRREHPNIQVDPAVRKMHEDLFRKK